MPTKRRLGRAVRLLVFLFLPSCAAGHQVTAEPRSVPSESSAEAGASAIVVPMTEEVQPALAVLESTSQEAAEQGTLRFMSAVSRRTGEEPPSAPLPVAVYSLGLPLYAEIDLPLSLADYGEEYGLDSFYLDVSMGHVLDGTVTPRLSCREDVSSDGGQSVTAALLRDARIPADIDFTTCMMRGLLDNKPFRDHESWSQATIELFGISKTTGIRPRTLAHGHIDLGIHGLEDQVEAYALFDRHLRERLAEVDGTEAVRRQKGLPASRMPTMDTEVLTATVHAKKTRTRQAVRVAITSSDWEYTYDAQTGRPLDRFVMGYAALRSDADTCVLATAAWLQRIDKTHEMQALIAPSATERTIPVRCRTTQRT